MFKKTESANSLTFAVHFYMGAYFCMGAYKCDVVVVIKMGAYIHGVLILYGYLLSRFYSTQGSWGRKSSLPLLCCLGMAGGLWSL